MDASRWKQVETLFEQLVETDRSERAAALNKVCADDPDLRRTLEGMLHSEELDDEFLTSPLDVMTEAHAPEVLGEFELEEEIGRGGMGVVYRAHQRSLDRKVALKVLPRTLYRSAAEVEQFDAEARLAARLQHAGIVTVYANGHAKGLHYFAMELVEGPNLKEVLDARDGHLTSLPSEQTQAALGRIEHPADMARLVAAIADALHAAHVAKLTHRDVKPSNIFLTATGQPKIGDFGLVMDARSAALSRDSGVIGSPHYMSPEQARGDKGVVGPRSDVYAVGVILYELLTGVRPFDGDEALLVLQSVTEREPPPVRSINQSAPRDLAIICEVAMAKRPEDRYVSARALADDLRRAIALEPILARALPRHVRAARWIRRHRGPLIAAASATALTALAAYGVLTASKQRSINASVSTLALFMEGDDAASRLPMEALETVRASIDEVAETPSALTRDQARTVEAAEEKLVEVTGGLIAEGQQMITSALASSSLIHPWEFDVDRLFAGARLLEQCRALLGEDKLVDGILKAQTSKTWRISASSNVSLRGGFIQKIDPVTGCPGPVLARFDGPGEIRTGLGYIRATLVTDNGELLEFERLVFRDSPEIDITPATVKAPATAFMVRVDPVPVTYSVEEGGMLPFAGTSLQLQPYWLDQFEVTNSEYAEFVDECGGSAPGLWEGDSYPAGKGDHPVTNVSPKDARRYAEWRGKRLPTLAELIYAGSGPKCSPFPWGAEAPDGDDLGNCTGDPAIPSDDQEMPAIVMTNTVPSRSMPGSATPDGIYHLFGNVSEMTGSLFVERALGLPLRTRPLVRFVTGGNWRCGDYDQTLLTSTSMATFDNNMDTAVAGFRCARSAELPD